MMDMTRERMRVEIREKRRENDVCVRFQVILNYSLVQNIEHFCD